MKHILKKSFTKSFKIFFHPKSPAAIYKDPGRFCTIILAKTLNACLRLIESICSGYRVQCNICGCFSRKFGYSAAISIRNFSKDDLCLKCGANKRTRLIIDLLEQSKNLKNRKVFAVDIGGLNSTEQFFLKYPNIRYFRIDKFKEADIKSDILDIGLLNSVFDLLFCSHVLEHVENYHKAMAELFRILKPGGFGIIAVPQRQGLKNSKRIEGKNWCGYGHIWEFGSDFSESLFKAGFQITKIYTDNKSNIKTRDLFLIAVRPINS